VLLQATQVPLPVMTVPEGQKQPPFWRRAPDLQDVHPLGDPLLARQEAQVKWQVVQIPLEAMVWLALGHSHTFPLITAVWSQARQLLN